eukprot:6192398-Pleurochrysis_carterae.AAC.3
MHESDLSRKALYGLQKGKLRHTCSGVAAWQFQAATLPTRQPSAAGRRVTVVVPQSTASSFGSVAAAA